MKLTRLRTGLAAIVLLAALVPAAAAASPFVTSRSILGFDFGTVFYGSAEISGDNIVYYRSVSGSGQSSVMRFDLVNGVASTVRSEPGQYFEIPRISGDWVVWSLDGRDLGAKNIRSGVVKAVTNDGDATHELAPAVSSADGSYVVWMGAGDIKGRNLGINGSIFTVAGGPDTQEQPDIYGKRVVYISATGGHKNVYVKTIGSGAAPLKLTDDPFDPYDPSIGSHLVAWLEGTADLKYMIRYYDFNTGLTYDGPSSPVYNMRYPQVSGDRILYWVAKGDAQDSDADLCVFDTRIARTVFSQPSFEIAALKVSDIVSGRIDKNQIVYLDGNDIFHAVLAVPSISLKAVPTRIARGGHIHLTGSISDQGQRIGSASLGIERYASGKWTRIKTLLANATGDFSYQTPRTYRKTKYRVVYNGKSDPSGIPWANHLSQVSATRTAWPR